MYKTIILPVVSCGCEIWSLTLREEHELRISENMVLRRIYELKRVYPKFPDWPPGARTPYGTALYH
jgi:hypothetical protein